MSEIVEYLKKQHEIAISKEKPQQAESYLRVASNFVTRDPKATSELYFVSKASSDVQEASNCLANLFDNFFIPLHNDPDITSNLEISTIINQLKEELKIIVSELKSHHLKLWACTAPAVLASRQTPSVSQSPMLSPRARMTSDERISHRDSSNKISDINFHSSYRIIFYSQLFENLDESTRRGILNYCIDSSDNPYECCRLMMLALSMMRDSFPNLSNKLIKNLIGLANPTKRDSALQSEDPKSVPNPRISMMNKYARSLLVLDATPLVLNISQLSELDIDLEELFEQALRFLSEHCLESAATECDFNELHEGVKKAIAARILGIDINSSSKDGMEELTMMTLSLLNLRYIDSVSDLMIQSKLRSIQSIIGDKTPSNAKFALISDIIQDLNSSDCDNIDSQSGSQQTQQQLSTPPPKARGRPKKKQNISPPNIEETTNKSKQQPMDKLKLSEFIFFSLLEYIMTRCLSYNRGTKSNVLINFENSVASQFEQEQTRSSQRSCRSKTSTQQPSVDSGPSPPKKQKVNDDSPSIFKGRGQYHLRLRNSPLSTKQSRDMDKQILSMLKEARECLDFVSSTDRFGLASMWKQFKDNYRIEDLEWFKRFMVDSNIALNKNDEASELLESILLITNTEEEKDTRKENIDLKSKIQASSSNMPNPSDLRRLTQLISTYVQSKDITKTFTTIEYLLAALKKCGLLNTDESNSNGNVIPEYMMNIEDSIGFLFFDTVSLVRYCVDVVMEILDHHIANSNMANDTSIGHTIILSQFDWPKEIEIYTKCINWIRSTKPKSTTPQYLSANTKFSYPDFLQFAKNPNLIEDFMALLRQGYTLDIKGSSTASNTSVQSIASIQQPLVSSNVQQRGSATSGGGSSTRSSGKAITTRGVNKTFKEDLKVAMVSQMKGSSVLISLDMISEFIRFSVLPYLSNGVGVIRGR